MDKNLLFYSNHCQYSQKLIKILNEEKIGHDIVRICIDSDNIRLPSFIKNVPTIYLSKEQKILTDDRLQEWLESNRQKVVDTKLSPFCVINNSFSECYSFINGDDQTPNNNFTPYDSVDAKINTPPPSEKNNSAMSRYEKLLESRGRDMMERAQRI